jgi:uncharacterized protein (DUF1697 family)
MPRYIAFLRAINVGGRTVKMHDLRALFVSFGARNVETFIASGNVVFDSPARAADALERRIEQQVEQALGYEVATFLRSPAEVAAVAVYQPFGVGPVEAGHALSVGFLKTPATEAGRQKLLSLATPTDQLHVNGREMYWLYRARSSDSVISGARLERALGGPVTLRNATTVRKLAAKYPAR